MSDVQAFYRGADYPPWVVGMSAASAWTWAPALILSTDIAANRGLLGAAAFVVPNILALWLFALVGRRVSPFALFRSGPVRGLYHAGYGAVEFFCLLIQVTAGANVAAMFFGVGYRLAACAFLGGSLALSLRGGLHASIRANVIQQSVLIAASVVLLAAAPGGPRWPVPMGVFSWRDAAVYSAILFSGPIMTHQHWQRADRAGYFLGGAFFAVPLAALSAVGLFSGTTGDYISMSIFAGAPAARWVLAAALLSGLLSTTQSALASVIGIFGGPETIAAGRWKMAALSGAAMAAVMFNFPILSLWKTMGAFRVAMAAGVIYVLAAGRDRLSAAL